MVTTAEIAGYTGCERHSIWCLSCIIRTGGALRPLSIVCSVWRQLERRIQLRFQDIATVYGYSLRLEFPPGTKTAHVAEGKITGFANGALRTVLCVGARRYTKDPAGRGEIGFVLWQAGAQYAPIVSAQIMQRMKYI